jgi:GT2 family glycosyltransferase
VSGPDVSVIVPLHRLTPSAAECLQTVSGLPGGRHELIVVSDRPVEGLPDGARLVLTGAQSDTSPAEKRDAALGHVRAPVCAFLDDDAYPASDWLDAALERLEDPSIAAVGGPGITPPGRPFRERLGGAFYESRLGSGGLRYRFVADGGVRDIDDYPAYNFFVRTEALRAVGGWATRFYGGEDTKVCLELVRLGLRIVYDPDVVVYHHRRPVFRGLMDQVANVGRHRGYFVRAFPETSARPLYFAPAAALVSAPLLLGWAVRRPRRWRALARLSALGVAAVWATGAREGHGAMETALLPAALVAGHGAYGAGFLRGLVSGDIESM